MISILVEGSLANARPFRQRIDRPSTYTHLVNAVGGYESASFTLSLELMNMNDWLANGLGRHVSVYNPALEVIWEGFVNQIDAGYGNLTVTRGPLLGTTNRLNASYATVDVDSIPPTEGLQAFTGWIDDLSSQTEYGILPEIISVGETNPPDATAIALTYLAAHRVPATTQVFTSAANAPQVTISCLGYRYWLMYTYNQLVNKFTINVNLKIIDILTGVDALAVPYNLNNAWLPFNTAHVATPAAPAAVPRYEYEDRTAWELIQGLTARGDANQNRWLFGIYANREAWYYQAPTTVEYTLKLSDPSLTIRNPAPVDPWDVKPGKWLMFTEFLPGYMPASLDDDPRAMFIESVSFTAPNQIALNGAPGETLSDVMASFGLGGVGV